MGVYSTFEAMVRAHPKKPISFLLLRSLFNGALNLPREAYLNFSLSEGVGSVGDEVAADRYRALFVAFEIVKRAT